MIMYMEKHAFLIIAHKHDLTFRSLLTLLDDERNDIFIHMDKKNKGYDPEETKKLLKHSNLYHTKRLSVNWGGYNQIATELLLLEEATSKGKYQYYHLLSGEDLPIKPMQIIHKTFDEINGLECVSFAGNKDVTGDRVRQYHLFRNHIKRGKNKILAGIEKVSVKFQKIIHVYRNKDVNFYKGINWFSITDAFARYVVSQKEWIHKIFKFSSCADELLIQTLVMNSEFKDHIHQGNSNESIFRLIQFVKESPREFIMDDWKELEESKMLFARKFNSNKSPELIEKLVEKLKK